MKAFCSGLTKLSIFGARRRESNLANNFATRLIRLMGLYSRSVLAPACFGIKGEQGLIQAGESSAAQLK
jgi:hypothetical protein